MWSSPTDMEDTRSFLSNCAVRNICEKIGQNWRRDKFHIRRSRTKVSFAQTDFTGKSSALVIRKIHSEDSIYLIGKLVTRCRYAREFIRTGKSVNRDSWNSTNDTGQVAPEVLSRTVYSSRIWRNQFRRNAVWRRERLEKTRLACTRCKFIAGTSLVWFRWNTKGKPAHPTHRAPFQESRPRPTFSPCFFRFKQRSCSSFSMVFPFPTLGGDTRAPNCFMACSPHAYIRFYANSAIDFSMKQNANVVVDKKKKKK